MKQGNKTELSCLYTKHKIQKRKVWNDGRLVVLQSCARLHDANPVPGSSDPVLDQCELSKDQRQVLLEKRDMMLEGEKFLIEVEGVWRPPCPFASKTTSETSKISSFLRKKFKVPPPYMPSGSNSQQRTKTLMLGKRKRPLQPGELAQIQRREAATNQNGEEKCEKNAAAKSNSRKFDIEDHGFPRFSFQEGSRRQRNLHANQDRSSFTSKGVSRPRVLRANIVSGDSFGSPEQELQAITSNRLQLAGKKNDTARNKNTLQRNEFDAGSFYGLEEEVDEENGEANMISNSMPVSGPPIGPSLATGPGALNVLKQGNLQSDNALLEMFGAVPVEQGAGEARQESHMLEQPKCDPTNFVLPSQSSSEDES